MVHLRQRIAVWRCDVLKEIFGFVGGIAGDAVELTKDIGKEVIDIPGAIMDGFNEGVVLTPTGDNAILPEEQPTEEEPVEPNHRVGENAKDERIAALEEELRTQGKDPWGDNKAS